MRISPPPKNFCRGRDEDGKRKDITAWDRLSALFGEEENVLENETVQTLPISRVEPRKDQPRRDFDPAAIEELAASIREYGLIQPITVRPLDKGYYQIIAGERRWRASRAAGLKEVPVRILEADDKLAMELALVENLQREDLNPMEEAAGYKKLMDDYGLTQEQVASRVQKSRPAVTNALRLLSLGETLQKKVSSGKLSAGHARALLPLKTETLREKAAAEVEFPRSERSADGNARRFPAPPGGAAGKGREEAAGRGLRP